MTCSEIRKTPCPQCPYRRDVPSGIWSEEEYDKLRPYDNETFAQPFNGFSCHATPQRFCHGWAVVHTSRGQRFDLIALRFANVPEIPPAAVPLFGSGNEAADHGMAKIEEPDLDARIAVDKLRRYPRIRAEEARRRRAKP